MSHPFLRSLVMLLATLAMLPGAVQAQDAADPWADWDAIVKEHVRPGEINGIDLAVLDYAGVKADPRWPGVVERLSTMPVPGERDAALAYWSNAYNILAVKVVLEGYPTDGIRELGGWVTSVWKKEAGSAGGQVRTLDEVEHGILRPMGEPLIHAAIVCASVSCPDLRAEAFTADRVHEQMAEQMRAFLANPEKGARVEENGRVLRVSRIFDWFREDFETDGRSLAGYLREYLPAEQRARLVENPEVAFFDYDWKLNDTRFSP